MSTPTQTSRTLHELVRASVGALRDSQRELGRALGLAEELHAEALALTNERDAARHATTVAQAAEEELARRFDAVCTERDAALAEISSAKGALVDLVKRLKAAETKAIEQDAVIRRSGFSRGSASCR